MDIKKKNGINMTEVENLYKDDDFRPVFEEYFKRKQIYRDLMQSRISSDTKKTYLERLPRF